MEFGQAVEALKQGEMVQRDCWHLPGVFVFMQVPAEIPAAVVPNMQSLPAKVKAEFDRRFNDANEQISAIYYNDQLAMVNQSNVITSYAPSVADVLANDWSIL